MLVPTYTEDQRTEHLAKFESQLAFVMDNANVDTNLQAHLANSGIKSLSRFANLGDDVAELKTVLRDELGLTATDGMAARLSISDVAFVDDVLM